jgi:hypothetical protein
MILACIGCGGSIETATTMPDAYRRLELLGYSHAKDSSTMGQEFVSYKRSSPQADYSFELIKWSSDDRLKEIIVSCYTDETGFNSEELNEKFWQEMERDFCSLVNGREEYKRAVLDLHEVKENDRPVLRHEGRATTVDGWQILVIEDVGHYKPQYEKPEKNWMRVGVIWATHLETEENIPPSAVQEFNRQLEAAQQNRD